MAENRAAIERRIRKLQAIADKHPDTEEGRSAASKAWQLHQKLQAMPKPKPSGDVLDRIQNEHWRRLAENIHSFAPGKDREKYKDPDAAEHPPRCPKCGEQHYGHDWCE